ncbi:MAG: hypothetical protein ACI81L_003381 [Verrucomicrobiales bacterium]|jgi:hypothetical protein
MWTQTPRRFACATFAFALIVSACGSNATTTSEVDPSTEASTAQQTDDHNDELDTEHDAMGGAQASSVAETLDVSADSAVPSVEIELTETDLLGTFDLVVSLTNFTIAPDKIDGEPVDNEGHMHLLIDGEKVERFTEVIRQVEVPDGEHLIEVELNANNHLPYSIEGIPIRSGLTVTGAGAAIDGDADDHEQGHDDADEGDNDEALSESEADVALRAALVAGEVTLDGGDRIEVALGDIVLILLDSDAEEHAHLHGYDILVDVGPAESATILFRADTAGKFELEFENSGAFIVELIVS